MSDPDSSHRITIVIIMLVYTLVGVKVWVLHSDIKWASDDYASLAASPTSSQPSNRTTSSANAGNTPATAGPPSPDELARPIDLHENAAQVSFARSSIPQLPIPARPRPPRQRRLSFRQYVLIPLLFFCALLATWVAPTVYRIYLFSNVDYLSYALLLAVSLLESLRGFFNAIIFLTMGMKGRRRRVLENQERRWGR